MISLIRKAATRTGPLSRWQWHDRRGWLLSRMALYCLCPALLVLTSTSILAGAAIDIVLSDDSRHYRQVAKAFREAAIGRHPQLTVNLLRGGQLEAAVPPPDRLLVAVGTDAAASTLARFPDNPRLDLFITGSAWEDLLASTPGTLQHPPRHAAILVDQPLERFIHLALLLKPDSRVLATVFGRISVHQQEHFEALARQWGLSLIDATLHTHDNPVTALTPLFADADLFIALPDRGLFNQSLARWALFLGYRHQVPVVGFSRAYTQAGALASLQSDPAAIGRQGAAWLDRYLAGQRELSLQTVQSKEELAGEQKPGRQESLWRAFPPSDFSVALNPSVARALGIATGSEDWLHQQLTRRLDAESSP